jgi:DnaJ-class molecular chaperone
MKQKRKLKICDICDGTGFMTLAKMKCHKCKGTGWIPAGKDDGKIPK